MLRCRIDHGAGDPALAVELIDPKGQLEAWSLDAVRGTIAEAEAAARAGDLVVGFVAYDAAPAFDPAFEIPGHGGSMPLAWFGRFGAAREVPLEEAGGRPSDATWSLELDQADHATGVSAIQAAIREGDTYLVNYTTQLRRSWVDGEDPLDLYRSLVANYAGGYHAFIETDDWAVACGSPELFFERRGSLVSTRPMKGTAPRGRWSAEDEELASSLACSPKEQAENVMVVDLLRNDLGRIATPGSVEVPSLFSIERHPALHQLTSSVTAEVDPNLGLAEVFAALFPSASVTGAPKFSTMRLIADLEPSARGFYCGAVGIITPDEDAPRARFAVAIRSAVVDKRSGEASYGTGGGITADSDPAAEWSELLLKATVLNDAEWQRAVRDLGLIETMGWWPAEGVRNLERHLERLSGSASYLGLSVPSDLEEQLARAVGQLEVPSKVRLQLDASGATLAVSVLEPNSAEVLLLAIDTVPVCASDPTLFHKTTDRRRYDERATRHLGADDVVLVNEAGEVTETTRANLAVQLEGCWCTPPLEAGLLPGVERARLLANGTLRERSITIEELRAADAVATLSSLRGWQHARVAR